MGFVFKSAVGLGAVYLAMFGPAPQPTKLVATAALCSNAVNSELSGDNSLAAHLTAARCGMSLASERAKLASLPSESIPDPPTAAKTEKAAKGTLTEADLRDAWFGPARLTRKLGAKG